MCLKSSAIIDSFCARALSLDMCRYQNEHLLVIAIHNTLHKLGMINS